jgi:ethanolamine ammonia-lyase small subunit
VVLAPPGRVALGDEVGERLGAAMVVVLGERPGLSAADSLGVYLTADPRVGRRDSDRNCISESIRPLGSAAAPAAEQLVRLVTEGAPAGHHRRRAQGRSRRVRRGLSTPAWPRRSQPGSAHSLTTSPAGRGIVPDDGGWEPRSTQPSSATNASR